MNIITRVGFILFILCTAMSASAEQLVAGNVVGRHIFGLATDFNNDPLMVDNRPLVYESINFENTLIREYSSFAIAGFGDTLGGLYVTRYDIDLKRYVDTDSFELASVEGLSRPRGGIVTNWGTVLFAESEQIDSVNAEKFINEFKPFYKGKSEMVNPYNYGWVVEAIVLDDTGKTKTIKNYSVGRVFASQLFMMPDGKSLYLFDKDNAGLLYLFVATEANSLAEGTLYGISLDNGSIVYDELGKTSALKMKFKLKKVSSFDKLFESKPPADGKCQDDFSPANGIYGNECLKVKKRNAKYAGIFEPARKLALMRNGRPLTLFSDVVFNKDKNRVTLTSKDGTSTGYQLGKDKEMSSTFIIN